MRVEALFADLEGRLVAERERRELDDEVAERTRRERAFVTLSGRLAASVGAQLSLGLLDGVVLSGRLLDLGWSGSCSVGHRRSRGRGALGAVAPSTGSAGVPRTVARPAGSPSATRCERSPVTATVAVRVAGRRPRYHRHDRHRGRGPPGPGQHADGVCHGGERTSPPLRPSPSRLC